MLATNVLQIKEVGGFYRNAFAEKNFPLYHKSFCGDHCRQFLLGAVMGWAIEV